jgi:hypothetical protein
MFRLYTADHSKHYTGVLLKDARLLEVKNPDTNTKTIYSSLEEWQLQYPGLSLSTDEVQANKRLPERHGFNCPTSSDNSYAWVIWCYSIICEGAPDLLKNQELKDAYNTMVDVCTDYKDNIYHGSTFKGPMRYAPENIRLRTTKTDSSKKEVPDLLQGYCGSLSHTYEWGSTYESCDYHKYGDTVGNAYRKIVEIIKPALEEYMRKMFRIASTKAEISKMKRAITGKQNTIKRLQESVEYSMCALDKMKETLSTLEAGL